MRKIGSEPRFASRAPKTNFCNFADTLDRDRRRLLMQGCAADRPCAGSWSTNNGK